MARKPLQTDVDRPTVILDVAERLVQHRGFNALSYADIAAEVGITKASLHYHFAGKADLGRALITRYTQRFGAALDDIDLQYPDAYSRLLAYARIYEMVLREGRFCLCGMLAAEYETLSQPMRDAVVDFFNLNHIWLTRVLENGRADGTLEYPAAGADVAQMVLSGLEGALLVARPWGDVGRFTASTRGLLDGLRKRPATSVLADRPAG
jgi:TetR/AcrR family transcriptional repressor of nem operon